MRLYRVLCALVAVVCLGVGHIGLDAINRPRTIEPRLGAQFLSSAGAGAHGWVEEATTVRCTEEPYNRTCHYRNLYFEDGEFCMFVVGPPTLEQSGLEVRLTDKYVGTWAPRVRSFTDTQSLREAAKGAERVHEWVPGLTVYFKLTFSGNIGHLLFDSLYPIFLATVKLGRHEEPLHMVVDGDGCSEDSEAYRSGEKLAYLPDPSRKSGRTMRPHEVVVLQRRMLKNAHGQWESSASKPECVFETDVDYGQNAGELSVETISGEQAANQCCELCFQLATCEVAVLFSGSCYLKGAPPQGLQASRTKSKGRLSCRPKASVGSARPHARVQPRAGSPWAGENLTVPEAWVVDDKRNMCKEGVLQKFAMGGDVMRLKRMQRDTKEEKQLIIGFEEVIVGCGRTGNLVMDPAMAMGGSQAPLNGTRIYRDRMMRAHGIEPPAEDARAQRPLHAIVVDNKRFSEEDKTQLTKMIKELERKHHNLTAEYVKWPQVGDFTAHLRLVSRTDIYISAPGTGLIYAPFLWDGAVFVGLGYVYSGVGRRIPSYMEQQLAGGGTPYLRALFLSPAEVAPPVAKGLRKEKVMKLVDTAVGLVSEGFRIPADIPDNLSVEGRIMRELCEADPQTCRIMFAQLNGDVGPHDCIYEIWPEMIVYEVGSWSVAGRPDLPNERSKCAVNRTVLRQLRRKHGLPGFGAPETDYPLDELRSEAATWLQRPDVKGLLQSEAAARLSPAQVQRCQEALAPCLTVRHGEYEYVVCRQAAAQVKVMLRGLWRWTPTHIGDFVGVQSGTLMYHFGDSCRGRPYRTGKVRPVCGKAGLKFLREETCVYSFTLEHPCACD